MNNQYTIVGDVPVRGAGGNVEVLVAVCGDNADVAKNVLNRMKTSPNANDRRLIGGARGLRIKEVLPENAWWLEERD